MKKKSLGVQYEEGYVEVEVRGSHDDYSLRLHLVDKNDNEVYADGVLMDCWDLQDIYDLAQILLAVCQDNGYEEDKE